MSRAHVADPPPHLAAAYHEHTCDRCHQAYACYGPRHEPGSVRNCGGTKCRA